ncbi:MAG: alkaline phosphatase [Spirochaetes bacterium]|nr:alkaline phosphatase [Spirochaetota bacterium]
MFKKTVKILFLIFILSAVSLNVIISAESNLYKGPAPKYVFLFIGDGMALPQVSSAEIYASALKNNKYPETPRYLSFTKFEAQGFTTTHDASSFITDSASAGTAIACGYKTLNGVISMDIGKKIKYKTIAEELKEKGMKVGIVTSVSIDHATPAVFYAKVPSRSMMYEIALQLAESGFDYFGGGSVIDPDGKKSKMDNKPGNVFDYAKSKGYKITKTKEEFMKLKSGSGKVWAVTEMPADAQSMLYEVDRSKDVLSLADFTAKGIELLDNPKGFFMMVEGGKIDWACHANDGLSAIIDVYAFDDAVKIAVEFAQKHPKETLIIVTGDHECGGMTVGFAGTKYDTAFQKLQKQKISYVKFEEKINELKKEKPDLKLDEIKDIITEYFGLTFKGDKSDMDLTEYEIKLLQDAFDETIKDKKERSKSSESYIAYGEYDPLTVTITHVLNRKAGIGWTTYSHTGTPVPTYAKGVGAGVFDGYYDNTDIYKKIVLILKIKKSY